MKADIAALVGCLLLTGCGDRIRPSIASNIVADIPSQESWNSTVTFSDSAKIKAVLWAGYIAVYAAQQHTLLKDSLHVDFYNEREEHTSLLTARRGKVNDQTQDFTAYGNVVVTSDSGAVLKTDSLVWTNATRKIQTEAFVEIISPTEHIMGHGMISDQALRNYTIFKVTGKAATKQ